MFDQVYENMQAACNTTMRMQQDMFKRWLDMWTTSAKPPTVPGTEQVQQFQKNWMRTVEDIVKQQQESLDKQFQAGLKGIENAFEAAESSNIEDLRKKNLELWKKNFDCLRQTYETQLKDFQSMVSKWTEIMAKGAS